MFGKGKRQQNKLQKRGTDTSQFGICICPQCNYEVIHKRGVPCNTFICSKCNIPLIRQGQSVNSNTQQVPNKNTPKSSLPKIDNELCIGCGACVDKCPSEAIHLEDGKAKITIANCKNCKACINACPVGAIT